MGSALTDPFIANRPLEPSPVLYGADYGSNLFETVETRQPQPVHAITTTYSSLEGWNGAGPSNRSQTEMVPNPYSAGGETITSASNSPITPPYQQFLFDNSQRPSPAPLAGHASEYLDNQWPYDSQIPDFGTPSYQAPQTAATGYQEESHTQSEMPCSPGGIRNLTGHIHGLALGNEMAPPFDHRQRSISLDSGAHHQIHNPPHLLRFSSHRNFKNP